MVSMKNVQKEEEGVVTRDGGGDGGGVAKAWWHLVSRLESGREPETHKRSSVSALGFLFSRRLENKVVFNMPKEHSREPARWHWEGNRSWPQLQLYYV